MSTALYQIGSTAWHRNQVVGLRDQVIRLGCGCLLCCGQVGWGGLRHNRRWAPRRWAVRASGKELVHFHLQGGASERAAAAVDKPRPGGAQWRFDWSAAPVAQEVHEEKQQPERGGDHRDHHEDDLHAEGGGEGRVQWAMETAPPNGQRRC